MIYKLFRLWANIAIRVFYGKIEVSGIENIPKDGPMLIASNHPNGFLEPIIMACLFPRPLHFMVRGDVFRKKWLKPILIQTNQIPIFRFKDGFAELRKNDSNLKEAYKALDKGAAIILFIEGGTINIKKLRPFQKGLARMALSYLDTNKNGKELNVLPVAINFVSPFVLRSRVVLNIGEACRAQDYFNDDAPKTTQIKNMTNDLYSKIKPLAFHVSDDLRQETLNRTLKFTEGLFALPFFPMVSYKNKTWRTFKSVADQIDTMTDEEFGSFKEAIDTFGEISENSVKRKNKMVFASGILSVLLLPLALLGLVLNILPGGCAQLLAKKVLDESNTVFRASIILSSGVGFYVVYYVLVILCLSIFFGFKSLMFLLAWPLGFVYLLWKNLFRSSFLKGKYLLSNAQENKLISLLSKHGVVLQ